MPAPISAREIAGLAELVRRETGIELDAGKDYLLESRLRPVLDRFGLPDYLALCRGVERGEPRLREALVDAITTGETSFFRDGRPFELLRFKLVPDLLGADPRARLRIWSAACSSGQELYSIAITLREILFDLERFDVQILGTDISDAAVQRASKAEYSAFETGRGLAPGQLERYFVPAGSGHRVRDELRAIVTVRRLNLLRDARTLGPFDIVFCRNVACYFDRPTRERLYRDIAATLRPGGVLLLGSTESIVDPAGLYAREDFRGVFYYRKPR